jgi:hypothetical protein
MIDTKKYTPESFPFQPGNAITVNWYVRGGRKVERATVSRLLTNERGHVYCMMIRCEGADSDRAVAHEICEKEELKLF